MVLETAATHDAQGPRIEVPVVALRLPGKLVDIKLKTKMLRHFDNAMPGTLI
jgi:hypothetical protein